MPSNHKIIQVVRKPDERYDNEFVMALTRQRILEMFPATEERCLQADALLVRHPYLHPKFSTKLLPADNLYTAIREESEQELFGALLSLGASEVELEQFVRQSESERIATEGSASYATGKVGVATDVRNSRKESTGHRIRISAHPMSIDYSALDKRMFFDELVYNKSNRTLELLFDGLKSGERFKQYEMEFKHTISRAYALEVHISASYAALFKAELNFKYEFERNRVESAQLIATFTSDLPHALVTPR